MKEQVTKRIKHFNYKGRFYDLGQYSIPDVIAGRAMPIQENNYVPSVEQIAKAEALRAKQNAEGIKSKPLSEVE